MPLRKTIFANGEIYHIVNRGVASFQIFNHLFDYKRFLLLLDFYRFAHASLSLSFSRYLDLNKG